MHVYLEESIIVKYVNKMFLLLSLLRQGINSGLRISLQTIRFLLSTPLVVSLIIINGLIELLLSLIPSKQSATSATQKKPLTREQSQQLDELTRELQEIADAKADVLMEQWEKENDTSREGGTDDTTK